jgi:hypothetical protein
VEIEDIVGVKDPNQTYRVVKINFGNDDGVYQHTIFEPKPDDFNRGENSYTDPKTGKENKIPQPSNVESMMLLLKHAIDAFVPEIGQQIDSGKKQLTAPDWDTLRKLVVKILTAGKGRESKIKLIKNKKGEGVFPGFFSGINKDKTAYIRNNFIGDKVAFSAYEMKRISDEANSAPKNMSNTPELDIDNTDLNDLDLDLDLANL